MVDQLVVTPTEAGHARLALLENERIVVQTPPLQVEADRLRVLLSAPWLYPPPEHPYWDTHPDAVARGAGATASLAVGGQVFSGTLAHNFDADSFEPAVLDATRAEPTSPAVVSTRHPESGQAGQR